MSWWVLAVPAALYWAVIRSAAWMEQWQADQAVKRHRFQRQLAQWRAEHRRLAADRATRLRTSRQAG